VVYAIPLLFVLVSLLIVGLSLRGGQTELRGRTRDLEAFAASLQKGSVSRIRRSPWWDAPSQQVLGVLPSGRQARVTGFATRIVYEVEVPGWTADLVVTRVALEAQAAGGSGQAEAARAALWELAGVLDFGEVHLVGGWLRIEREALAFAFKPAAWRRGRSLPLLPRRPGPRAGRRERLQRLRHGPPRRVPARGRRLHRAGLLGRARAPGPGVA
jgi:hypothetical protein